MKTEHRLAEALKSMMAELPLEEIYEIKKDDLNANSVEE